MADKIMVGNEVLWDGAPYNEHLSSKANPHETTKEQTGAAAALASHNTSETAHGDIRSQLNEKANKAQEGWLTPTLLNGWVNFDEANFQSVGYIKDTLGFVVIRGVVKSGVIGSAIFQLPVGYRPSKFYRYDTENNYAHCAGFIANNGNVIINTASANHSVSLNIRFKAEV